MFKNLANLSGMLKQAQEMGSKIKELNEQARQQRTEASAGGGMVTVEINGAQEILGVRIDPSLIEQKDRELIEDLVAAAVNQAIAKSKEMHAEAMKSLAGGMNLPGLDDALAQFTGSGKSPE